MLIANGSARVGFVHRVHLHINGAALAGQLLYREGAQNPAKGSLVLLTSKTFSREVMRTRLHVDAAALAGQLLHWEGAQHSAATKVVCGKVSCKV